MDDVFDTSAESAEVETLHENVQDFVEITEQLEQDKTLTPELALESIPVLGHNGLFDAYYSVGSKQKRYAIATESFQKRMIELWRQAYDLLKRIVKKCIDWVKSLFGGKKNAKESKEQIRQAEGNCRLVLSAVQEATELREPKTFREVVMSHKLDSEFIHAMDVTEYDIFTDGPYMKAILELAKELEHSNALTEISTQLTGLDEWFAKVVSEARTNDANHVPVGAEQTGVYYDEKSKSLSQDNREATDVLLKLFWAAKDVKSDHLGKGSQIPEKVYDLRGMADELERIITRISINDTGPLLDRWQNVLGALDEQFKSAEKTAQLLDQEGEDAADGESGRNRQTLSAQYLNALGTFGSRITQIQQAIMLVQNYLYKDSFTLYYRILTFLNKAAAAYQHEEPSEETYKLFQMTKEILAKRHA